MTNPAEAWQTIEALGLPLLIVVGVVVVVVALALLFGAACLHVTTRAMKFKKCSFRKAFGTNLLVVAAPALGAGGVEVLKNVVDFGADPAWPYVSAAVSLAVMSVLFPVLIIRHYYRQAFTRALIAYVCACLLELVIVFGLFLTMAATLVALSAWFPAKPH